MRTIYFERNIPKVLLTGALRSIWKNVVFTPLSPTRFAEVPDPPLPGPRWVRVRNRLGGICASDLHLLYADEFLVFQYYTLPLLSVNHSSPQNIAAKIFEISCFAC